MQSLLSKVKKSDVITEPFPHIIIKDALEEDFCSQLAAEFPSIETLSQGMDNAGLSLSSNIRVHYLAKDTFSDPQISPLWKEFISLHTSNTFFQEFIEIFKDSILQMYPNFEQEYGSLEKLSSGMRKIDTLEIVDVLLDALICVNTPVVTQPTSVRRTHIDLPDKLFAGLFYMRDPQDTSTGGDLDIYKFKHGKPQGFRNSGVDDKYVDYIKTIKYERNVLVLFINSLYSLHGVTVRSLTNYPRYFVNLVGEVKKPLFDRQKYQEANHIKYWRKIQKVIKTFN